MNELGDSGALCVETGGCNTARCGGGMIADNTVTDVRRKKPKRSLSYYAMARKCL